LKRTDFSARFHSKEMEGKTKTIILGVTGSIAAHRAVDLTSRLTKAGADVRVVLTRAAMEFVKPLPFQTLSRNPVVAELFDERAGWQPTHIELADRADLLLVAPATADFIARYAHGLADDALTCVALALRPEAKVLLAPAMNAKMWRHPATQANARILAERGVKFIGPEEGALACGYEGPGRLASLDRIEEAALAAAGLPSAEGRRRRQASEDES